MKFVRAELKGPKLLRPPGPGFLTHGPGQPSFHKQRNLPGFISSSHRTDSATQGSPLLTNCEGLACLRKCEQESPAVCGGGHRLAHHPSAPIGGDVRSLCLTPEGKS